MITEIKTKGLKGLDINEFLSEKNLYIGPNGSGKSTRSLAIALVIMGYIPWAPKPKKKPADILDAYGSGDSLTVAAQINNTWFERKFTRNSKGTVSQKYRVNQNKATKEDFPTELYKAGSPKILDLGSFMDLSDQKKIDLIFNLFPPSSDVGELDSQIEDKTDDLNKLNQKVKTFDGTIKNLSSNRAEIKLPAGTLAEIRKEIEETKKQWTETNNNIKDEEIKQAAIKATEKAKKEAEEEAISAAIKERDDSLRKRGDVTEQQKNFGVPESIMDKEGAAKAVQSMQGRGFCESVGIPRRIKGSMVVESLNAVLKTLDSAGCGACAAKLALKKELKKYRNK